MEIPNNLDELAEGISAHKHSQGLVYMRKFLMLQVENYRDWLERETEHHTVIAVQNRLRESRDLLKLIGE